MSTSTISTLVEQVSSLPADRRGLLMENLEGAAMAEQPKDVPGQLPLFDFRNLVESDDALKTVTLEQIAGTYEISELSLQRYIRAGQLIATRFGRKYVVTVKELKRFLSTPRLKKPQGMKGRPKHGRAARKRKG